MELIGKVLGNRYEMLEKIGIGGMATVYKAMDKTLNRNVAIKVLKEEFATDQEFIKRFQIEAQSAAALSHPNIVSIYDVANEDNINYIVMELIVGKTLKEVIIENGKLDWKKSAEIASQIASGLYTAHKNHIIHRDIKPHNIILTKDNLVKITDFGIAKAATSSTINANSSSMGSVHYFSPEHARGGYTDEKSDIYSLGVVLYEMVTGKLPFEGDTPVSVAMKHLKEDPVPPKKLNPEIPQGLNDIILKAMQKEVASRYVNAQEMYIELQKLLKNPEVTNVGITKQYQDEFATQKVPIINSSVTRQYVKEGVKSRNNMSNDSKVQRNKVKSKKRKNPLVSILIMLLLICLVLGGAIYGAYAFLTGISGNVEEVKVPDIVGVSKDVARTKLESIGLEMDVKQEIPSNLPKDYIVDQELVDKTVAKGTTVKVSVSLGPQKVLVPNVVGYSVTAANIEIKNKDLKIEVVEEPSEDVEIDKIIKQEPAPGSEVFAGDTVTVYVSSGLPEDVNEVPNVLEATEAGAKEMLEAMGFVPIISYVQDTTKEDGKILDQTPDAGSKAAEGSTVIVIINQLTPPAVEPTMPEDDKKPEESTQPQNNDKQEQEEPKQQETPQPQNVPDKKLSINLKNKGSRDSFEVKVILNGDYLGRKDIYKGQHTRNDGMIQVDYPGDATGVLQVYIDGVLDSEQVIK